MSDRPTSETTAGVVVTYDPDDGVRDRVAAMAAQVARVLVVDNASRPRGAAIVGALASLAKVELLRNERNLGVATALNQGAAWARGRSSDWLLLADHDTELAPDALATLEAAWSAYPAPSRIAVIGANFVDPNIDRLQYPLDRGDDLPWSEQPAVISAGSLLSLAAFERIGPFRDDFFIDHVDHEYCLRARREGFAVLATRRPVMRHTVGRGRRHRLGIITHDHSPERWYYMLRNEVALVRDYLWREPRWTAITIHSRIRSLVFMLVFEAERGAKLRRAAAGFRDGLAGRFPR
jgi:rhamnosyltransferase